MTILKEPDTLCEREGNHCGKRRKCKRFLSESRERVWESPYYEIYGYHCPYFLKHEIPQTEDQ